MERWGCLGDLAWAAGGAQCYAEGEHGNYAEPALPHCASMQVGLHAKVDSSGVFHIDRADTAIEVIEVLPAPDVNASAVANETAAADGKAGAGANDIKGDKDTKKKGAEKGKVKEAAAGKPDPASAAAAEAAAAAAARVVRRTLRLPLNVTGGLAAPGLLPEQLAAGRRVLRALREADEAKRETAKAKNDLESYIIGTRDKVGWWGGGLGGLAGIELA